MDISKPLVKDFDNITIHIDAAQRATILAALLHYQDCGMGDPWNRPMHIHDCATEMDQQISLDEHGIVDLFSQIATAQPSVTDTVSDFEFIQISDDQTQPFPSLTFLLPPKSRFQ